MLLAGLVVMVLAVMGGLVWAMLSRPPASLSILPIKDQEVRQGEELRVAIPLRLVGCERWDLSYSLGGAPEGAKIDAKGEFSWHPTAAQDAREYKIVVKVVGPGGPPLADRRTFTVRLIERPDVEQRSVARLTGPSTPASAPVQVAGPFEIAGDLTPTCKIDEMVFAKLKELKIEPANLCADGVFLRRAYLDVIGTLPAVAEAREFLKDTNPQKRKALVDKLLARPEYADYWAMKWSDILRVKAEFPINLWPNAAQAYHRWLRKAVHDNMPYDRFARELLTASGSNFRTPQVNFYRALQARDPPTMAKAAALAFMGVRAEKWPKEQLAGMAAFFSQVGLKPTGEWKEEIVIWDPRKKSPTPTGAASDAKPAAAKSKPAAPPRAVTASFPDGTTAVVPPDRDPREVFADWLIRPENPWFARHIVNRIWYWLIGRGVVHEPDDIRPDNPAQNPELLTYLADELVKSKYDLKHIFRLILNSKTYQLSSIAKHKDPQVAAANFACYTIRRLEAEVIIDAICQITGTSEAYSSIIPEPYTFIPEGRRSIQLPDGSISSAFLELFGRPARDTGLESERNNRVTAGQRLHLLNSSHIRNKLRDGPGMKAIAQQPGDATENMYLAVLSRLPYGEETGGGGEMLAWALINSNEFLYKH